ncbi:MAG: leucine-rich repeat domain-containing protein [bacterium]|nr:leucine-rich repeat domain-containing protein [bacterium]
MIQEKELVLGGVSLYYEIEDGKARITDCRGPGSEVVIPDRIEGYPVAEIGKKAFLSKKRLRRVTLPRTTREVGDWAFAHCDNLTEVCLPDREIRFGRAVFLECGNLRRISRRSAEEEPQGLQTVVDNSDNAEAERRLRGLQTAGENLDIAEAEGKPRGLQTAGKRSDSAEEEPPFEPELLAAAVRDFGAYYLLDIPAAGSREWLDKWDARLAAVMGTSDQEGYSRQVLCGEEDYGSTDPEAYVNGRRKEKVRLAFLRLLFPRGLSEVFRRELEEYLLKHTAGKESDETWQVILQEHGEDRAYYGLFAELGCVTGENLDGILADIGENFPEMKAFFLRSRESGKKEGGFFESLEW